MFDLHYTIFTLHDVVFTSCYTIFGLRTHLGGDLCDVYVLAHLPLNLQDWADAADDTNIAL